MLRIKSDLNQIVRFGANVEGALAAGTDVAQGSWVVKTNDLFELPDDGVAGAFQIFTESNRDGTAGWAPQASASPNTRLTALHGKYIAATDRYDGTPVAGDTLGVNAAGNLAVIDDGTGDTLAATSVAVAVCTKEPYAENHLDADTTMIEFATL